MLPVFTILAFSGNCAAQDPNFTQFYNAPLYLNPAFTGMTPDMRFATSYRRQWAQVPDAINTNIFSFDYNLEKQNSGIGLLLMNDRFGAGNLQANHILLSYAYFVPLSSKWQLSAGLQGGYVIRSAAWSNLRFGDQIAAGGGSSQENIGDFSAGLPDISAGVLLHNGTLWLGGSVFHLNQPEKLTEAGETELLARVVVHGGARFPLSKAARQQVTVSPAFLYQAQGPFSQLDVGVNFFYAPVMAGLWYRGIPVKQNASGAASHDALSFLTGIQFDNFLFGYSYDMNISGLYGNSGGSHELSLVWEPGNNRGRRRIQCPAFYNLGQPAPRRNNRR